MRKLQAKLTYANVMATIAVFIALGGASYAALKLPKNSVGSKQLKRNSVTAAKIKNGAVSASKVAKNSLTGTEIKSSTLGTVPSAAHATTAVNAASATNASNAAALGGVGPAGFLAAEHVISGRTIKQTKGGPILTDPRTGLEVASTKTFGLALTNSTNDRVFVSGVGFASAESGLKTLPLRQNLAPGDEKAINFEGAGVGYLSMQVIRQTDGLPSTFISCAQSFGEESDLAFACTAVG